MMPLLKVAAPPKAEAVHVAEGAQRLLLENWEIALVRDSRDRNIIMVIGRRRENRERMLL